MRTRILIVLIVFVHTLAAQNVHEGDSWRNVTEKGEGKLSVVFYECPRLIEQVNGEMKGLCVDIMQDFVLFVKTKYNKKIEVQYIAKESQFSDFLKTVKHSPSVIGISNTTITSERKSEMKFSPYFIQTPLVVLTNKNVPNYQTLDQLIQSGGSAVVEKETAYEAYMQNMKTESHHSLKIEQYNSTAAVIDQLLKNNKAFTVMDFTEYLGETKNLNQIKRQPVNLGLNEKLGFVMSKKSDWDVLFNEFLNENYRNSASYKRSITENLGSNFMAMLK